MKTHHPFVTRCFALLLVTALLPTALLTGCRKKTGAKNTITRAELDKIFKGKAQADRLTSTLESAFGDRGYSFSARFSNVGSDPSATVKTLSRGPKTIHVSGARTLEEAIELDREVQRVLSEEKFAGIEVFYEMPPESEGGSSFIYSASLLVERAEFLSDIKRRQQGAEGQNPAGSGAMQDGNQKPQTKSGWHPR